MGIMPRKLFFTLTFLLVLAILPRGNAYGLLSDNVSAANNSFSTALVFSMPTPSPTVNPSPTPLPSADPFSFPNCPTNPGDNVNGKHWDVGYDEGEHWIISIGMKHGSDYVYYLDDTKKVLQCYYPLPRIGDAIQTDWWKKNRNGNNPSWDSWPNGADFGLDHGTYFYKNTNFSIVQDSPSPTPTISPTASPSPSASTIDLTTPESSSSASQ